MSAALSGAREGRASWLRRLVARASARDLQAFVVPGPEVARAYRLDLEVGGLRLVDTPRHASVLVLVGELPEGLKRAAAVAYAQMPRPRAILGVGAGDVSPLPGPDASAGMEQEALEEAVVGLRRSFAEGAFSPEAPRFDVYEIRTQTEYVCPMHPEVVSDEPGSCPKCGMDLVPREAAGGTDHGPGHDHMDHSGHEGMEHSHKEHDQASREHPGHGGRDDADHGVMDRGDHSGGHEAHGHGETGHGSHEEHDSRGGAHHEDMGHGGGEGHAGMEHEEAAEGHGSHDGMNHSHMDHGEHQEHDDGSGKHAEHSGHDHMAHGGMGFMSMVEMTKDLPRSSDGLPMEWVEAPFGPLFPGLPGGLSLTLTLDGDTVAGAEAEGAGGGIIEDLAGAAETFADHLSGLDPLSPVAYRLLAIRAVEEAAGISVDEETALARAGALERERVASHLNWLASFAHLLGYAWLEDHAARLQLAFLRAEGVEEVARQRGEVLKLAQTVERTPLLKRKLQGIGRLPGDTEALGPVARAGGPRTDARAEDEVYRALLGFEPVVREGNDALSRLLVRLEESERSLDLVRQAGHISTPALALDGDPSGSGAATVETARGAATLRVTVEGGAVRDIVLDTPSAKHMGSIEAVTAGEELANALIGVASLDISPWEVVR